MYIYNISGCFLSKNAKKLCTISKSTYINIKNIIIEEDNIYYNLVVASFTIKFINKCIFII